MNEDMANPHADWQPIALGGVALFRINNSVEICVWSPSLGFPLCFLYFTLIFPYVLSVPPGFSGPSSGVRAATDWEVCIALIG